TAVSVNVAERLDIGIGDTLTVTSQRGANRTVSAEVVGVWRPADPADAYWDPGGLALAGVSEASSFVTQGPLVVDWNDLVGRAVSGDIGLEFRALPDFDNLAVDDVNAMRSDTAALDRRLSDAL